MEVEDVAGISEADVTDCLRLRKASRKRREIHHPENAQPLLVLIMMKGHRLLQPAGNRFSPLRYSNWQLTVKELSVSDTLGQATIVVATEGV